MKIIQILLTAINVVTLLPWYFFTAMSTIMFDVPENTKLTWQYWVMALLLSYPVLVIVSIYKSWTKNSIYWSFAPILVFVIASLIISKSNIQK